MALRIVQAVDPAIGKSSRADWFVIATAGLEMATRRVHLLDIVRGRFPAPEQPRVIEEAYIKWRPMVVGIESIFYQTSLIQYVRREGVVPIIEIRRHRDKEARLMSLATRYQNGQIVHPPSATWLDEYETELCSIQFIDGRPVHEHDDQADAAADAVDLLTVGIALAPDRDPVVSPISYGY